MSNYNNLANVGLGALQGQANAGQTYANNMSSIAQQSAALAAANANKPSSLQTAISGGTSGAIAGAGLASLLGTSTPWGAGIGAGIGLLWLVVLRGNHGYVGRNKRRIVGWYRRRQLKRSERK